MVDKLIIVFVVFILIVLGFIGFEATKSYKSPKDIIVTPIQTPECDLQANDCNFNHPNFGKVTVSINPKPIRMNIKQTIEITLEKGNLTEGWIDFLGLEMDMGFNRPKLVKESDGKYYASVVLPTCTQQKMTWKATTILKDINYIGAPFKFITVKED